MIDKTVKLKQTIKYLKIKKLTRLTQIFMKNKNLKWVKGLK